jgi:pilus assembly protein CpaB
MLTSLRSRLDGPPPALPRLLDRAAERWWAARPRSRAALVAAALVLLLAGGVVRVTASPHGPPVTVLVATRDLPVGHELAPDDLRRARWPRDLVPAGAATDLRGTVVGALPAGAVATDRHVAVSGLAAALPDGHAAVPVPTDAVPTVPTGARLDVVVADLDGGVQVLARSATVLGADGDIVWFAVATAQAPAVAGAASRGGLSVVLLPP